MQEHVYVLDEVPTLPDDAFRWTDNARIAESGSGPHVPLFSVEEGRVRVRGGTMALAGWTESDTVCHGQHDLALLFEAADGRRVWCHVIR